MAKFKVVLKRTDTITKQAEMMVEAETTEQARQKISADLDIDPGSYDDDLEPVAEGTGDMTVTTTRTENRHDPAPIPRSLAS
jgi:hypothetical protein